MLEGAISIAGSDEYLIPCVQRSTNVLERMRGLLGRPPLAEGEGLLIVPCPSVHTLFMAYPIDLVFLDRDWRVLRLIDSLPPWRMAGASGAYMTLELAAGSLRWLPMTKGCRLSWSQYPSSDRPD